MVKSQIYFLQLISYKYSVLAPVPNAMETFLRQLPYFNDVQYDKTHLSSEEQIKYLVYP